MGQLLSLDDYGQFLGGLVVSPLEALIRDFPYLKLELRICCPLPNRIMHHESNGSVPTKNVRCEIYCATTDQTYSSNLGILHADDALKSAIANARGALKSENEMRKQLVDSIVAGASLGEIDATDLVGVIKSQHDKHRTIAHDLLDGVKSIDQPAVEAS